MAKGLLEDLRYVRAYVGTKQDQTKEGLLPNAAVTSHRWVELSWFFNRTA